MAQRTNTLECKLEAVRLAQRSGKGLTQVARDLGISDSTLSHRCKRFGQHGEKAFQASGHQRVQEEELRRMNRELDLMRQERDIVKKALIVFSRT